MKKNYIWHPNTQMKEWDEFHTIKKGRGMWLVDSYGNKLLDGVASMWCNVWGHSKKELVDVIIKQTRQLQHSSLFNLTNEPSEKLAKKLIQISPYMNKVFYSDNGSTAMEIACKMALQYWQNIGINKNKFVTFENGYHGDTFGTMSIGYIHVFFSKFKRQLFPVIKIKVPTKSKILSKTTFDEQLERCLNKLEKIFSNNNKIAAFVMESGAQIAGGVIIYPDKLQQRISKLCKKYDVLLILDEIATGFGRLGSFIEYKKQHSIPDIVAYGKMLTGGYMTLSATLTTEKIYNAFIGNFYDMKHLFHGHTYTGNPIASAVALENLNLYKKNGLIKKIKITSDIFKKRCEEIINLNIVGDVRTKGLLMGIDLRTSNNNKSSVNKVVFSEGIKNRIYLRTLGSTVILVPPLAIAEHEINFLINMTIKTIKKISNII